jgi:hypothetical protein
MNKEHFTLEEVTYEVLELLAAREGLTKEQLDYWIQTRSNFGIQPVAQIQDACYGIQLQMRTEFHQPFST